MTHKEGKKIMKINQVLDIVSSIHVDWLTKNDPEGRQYNRRRIPVLGA